MVELKSLPTIAEFLEIVRVKGLQEAKCYAKQLGPEGRILLNAIGVYEAGQIKPDSNKPVHRLAGLVAQSANLYEHQVMLNKLVSVLIEGEL
jgi:hypothetical protein